jgi:hypothetical protein
MAHDRDEGLRAPMAERGMLDKPLVADRPAGTLGHAGFQPGFVNEGKTIQHIGHEGLAMGDPAMPQACDSCRVLFFPPAYSRFVLYVKNFQTVLSPLLARFFS